MESLGGKEGDQDNELHFPMGVATRGQEVYVCDQKNGRVQVFNLDLKFVRTLKPVGKDHFKDPSDVTFDSQGRMYVAEYGSSGVVVMTTGGKQLQVIDLQMGGQNGRVKPQSIHVVGDYLYVSDVRDSSVAVFHTASGNYVTSLGRRGHEEGAWLDPRGIASFEGNIFFCGSEDGNIHTF